MADVSVEFGAKDTGLEQTLKTVQDELSKLESEVKSGELSFDALQQTMRKLAQTEKLEAQLQGMATGVDAAGNAAANADPKVDAIGKQMKQTGNEAKDVGDKSEGGFLKMASAVAAGQAAVNVATAAMRGAFNAVKGAVDDFGAALDLGGRLSDLSERTGEAAGNVLLLERAFQNSGAGAEKVGPAINKLQKFIEDAGTGAKEQVDAMDRLALSLSDLAGKTPTEQMQVFADRITAIEDPGKRAALAMEVFGRAGGELLPLLTNFSGELGTAQDQLGGMVDIMNRQNAIFDAVSDKIAIIRGKFMEFAAGVLDKVAPALDAVTEALSRIDAAAIGQKLADMFMGGVAAMKGFQASVDAFKTGNIEGALSLLWESVKLQAMQTADAIYKNLSAAFRTSGQVLAEVFRSDGPTFMMIRSTFDFIAGYIKEKIAGAMSDMFASMGPAFNETAQALKIAADGGAQAAELALQRIPVAAGLAAEDIANLLGKSPEAFKTNLQAAGDLFPNLEERAAALAAKQKEVADEAAKHAPAIVDATNATQALLEAEREKLAAELASAKAKGDTAVQTFAQIENEIALNNAIASGNEKEVERLRRKQEILAIEAEIPKIMEDIIKKTETSEETARGLAEQIVASRINAKGLNDNLVSVNSVISEIEKAKMDNPPKSMNERLKDAQGSLSRMKDFIGEDLNKMSLADIMKKLGLSAPALATTDEKLKMVEEAVKKIGEADPADITPTVDKVGVNDKLEAVREYLKNTSKEKPDVTPTIDQSTVKSAVDAARSTIDAGLMKSPVGITLNAEASIGKIREQLKDEIDLSLSSSKGTQHLSGIEGLVGKIESLVAKIEGKLPLQALAY